MNQSNFIIPVLIDFRRAFETVDRNSLLNKMKKMGIGGFAVLSDFGMIMKRCDSFDFVTPIS